MARDKEVSASLEQDGWTVIRFWEHQIRKELDSCVKEVLLAIANRKSVK